MNHKPTTKRFLRGSVIPALLIITTAFVIIIYGILFVLTLQYDFSNRQVGSERSLHIAEAGVNYYRWHLAHDPTDYQDGTGGPGPYEHEYTDPQGSPIGKYSLEITPPRAGSSLVTISSTGWSYQYPNVKRKITVQYGQPSFAAYSFLNNASAWYGNGITVSGPIHSNNGIRMDGTNLSLVTSAKETYHCGSETGCSPPQWRPGVWGSGGDSGLWQFPVPPLDFDSISFDLAQMRSTAQTDGLYLAPSGNAGYHITFFDDGTFTVGEVTGTDYIWGYMVTGVGLGAHGQGGCRRRYQIINNETLVGTYNVADKPIIFVEDVLWIEGTLRGRVTVATASFPIGSSNVWVWIRDNLTYTTYDGSDTLGLISQNDIYFVRDVPNDFNIDAVLMAQQGSIIRHGYWSDCGDNPNAIRDKLTINGSVISYDKSYWNWTQSGSLVSGFIEREINYDANILYGPPPYFPTSGEYEFISWREE
ncbi:hypothetical protein KKB40_05940 [Patescibacteria group bacterium]|nr:hypothetical protein [Patescibacteria group bacterium]